MTNQIKPKTILICPLDWGMGHATRSVPIIKELLRQNVNVIIGAENRPLDFLKIEFPNLKFVPFPGLKVSYPSNNWMALKMFLMIPKFLRSVYLEHRLLKKIIKEYNVDVVISDNRYGLWNKSIKTVFITHQIGIKTPLHLQFLKPIILQVNKFFIHKFDELWIPDFEKEPNLSGSLTHGFKIKIPHFFIGPLSRFSKNGEPTNDNMPELMAIVSGPEPQRGIFENLLISELKKLDKKSIILRGQPEKSQTEEIENIKLVSHLPSHEFQRYFQAAKLIISRSGYCTLMDMAVMNKKAIIIPTPGQTEQEYLAERLSKKTIYYSQTQNKCNIIEAIKESDKYSGLQLINDYSILNKRLNLLTSN